MATDAQANSQPKNQGPGDTAVSTKGIIWIACFLLIAIIAIFAGILTNLPNCRETLLTGTNTNTNQIANGAVGNENTNTTGNVNQNSNANQPANTTNQNKNTGSVANSGTNSSTSENAETVSDVVKIQTISPAAGSVEGGALVTIKGSGFGKEPKVIFGGIPVEVVKPSSDESVNIKTLPSGGAGKVDVAVVNSAGQSDVLAAGFTFQCAALPETRLFWLVLLAGALGGAIHSLRSLWWYVGNRELLWSWVLMYVILPFTGAAIAAVFYLIVRGGFLQNAPATTDASLFLIAIAGLVGLFSQQAILKLQDIANAVLTKPGKGDDAREQTSESVGSKETSKKETPGAPTITIEPTKGALAGGDEIVIKGVSSVKNITFGGETIPAENLTFDKETSTVKFKTPMREEAGDIDVVIDVDNGAPVKLKFTYEKPPE